MSKRLTTEQFIEKATIIHANKYDYSLVNYIEAHSKIIIICPIHGKFEQTPNHHTKGEGCKLCYKRGVKLLLTLDQFIDKSNIVHDFKFDYSKVIYINSKVSVEIICKKHGPFLQEPSSHMQGHGCIKCRSDNISFLFTKTLKEFINDATNIHDNRYDYSKSIYINDSTKLEIICSKHGSFWQAPTNHLSKKGCPKCSLNISYKETEWLNMLNVSNEFRNNSLKINNVYIKPDAFNPNNNTIYEFYGDYWHGNPKIYKANDVNTANKKTFGDLFLKTMEKEQLIKNAGYLLMTIWESDFEELVNGN